MKAYPGRQLSDDQQNFNDRLADVRKIIEICFGRCKARWRCLLKRNVSFIEHFGSSSWKVDGMETLVELWATDSIQIKFNTMVHNGKIWHELAQEYNTQTGNTRSGAQVKEKIKRLKRQYRNREKQRR